MLEEQLVTFDQRLNATQVRERYEDGDLDGAIVVLGVAKGPIELLNQMRGLEMVEVHLPVAGHERRAIG